MITEAHLEDLLSCSWLSKIHEGVCYLAKFRVYLDTGSCIFLMTDTKNVWSEVVKANRLQDRFQSLNNGRKEVDSALSLVGKAHTIREFADTEVMIREGTQCDLLVTVTHPLCEWSWELDHVGQKLGSSIISQHLIVPLALTSGFAFNHASSLSPASQSSQDLQQDLDKFLKVSKRNPSLSVSQAFRRPRMSTAISRVTAVLNSVDAHLLPQIMADFDASDITLDGQSTIKGITSTSGPSKTIQSSDEYETPVSIPTMHAPFASKMDIVNEETLYTGPTRGTRGGSKSVEVDFETHKASTREEASDGSEKVPRTGRGGSRSMANDSDEDQPQNRASKRQKIAFSDEEARPPPTKDATGSTTEDSDEEPTIRPVPPSRGALAAGRVKQPIKRGGRRL